MPRWSQDDAASAGLRGDQRKQADAAAQQLRALKLSSPVVTATASAGVPKRSPNAIAAAASAAMSWGATGHRIATAKAAANTAGTPSTSSAPNPAQCTAETGAVQQRAAALQRLQALRIGRSGKGAAGGEPSVAAEPPSVTHDEGTSGRQQNRTQRSTPPSSGSGRSSSRTGVRVGSGGSGGKQGVVKRQRARWQRSPYITGTAAAIHDRPPATAAKGHAEPTALTAEAGDSNTAGVVSLSARCGLPAPSAIVDRGDCSQSVDTATPQRAVLPEVHHQQQRLPFSPVGSSPVSSPVASPCDGPLSRHRHLLPRALRSPTTPQRPDQTSGAPLGAMAAAAAVVAPRALPATPLGRTLGGGHLTTPSRVPMEAPPQSVTVGRGFRQVADPATAAAVTPRPGGAAATLSRLPRPPVAPEPCSSSGSAEVEPFTPARAATAALAPADATPGARKHLLSARRVAVPCGVGTAPHEPLRDPSLPPAGPAGVVPPLEAACAPTPLSKPARRCNPDDDTAASRAARVALVGELAKRAVTPPRDVAAALLGPEPARAWLRERLAAPARRTPGPSPAAGTLSASALLFGAEGTGKTEAARALAAEIGGKLLLINCGELAAREAGAARDYVRAAFEAARREAPAVLCFDDAHLAFSSGNGPVGFAAVRTEVVVQLKEVTAAAAEATAARNPTECSSTAGTAPAPAAAPRGGLRGGDTVAARAPRRPVWNAGATPRRGPAAGGGCPGTAPPPQQQERDGEPPTAHGAPALRQPMFVVLTTARPEALDPSVASSVTVRLLMDLPARETREEVITAQMLAVDAALTAGDVDALARGTGGFSCSDLLRLCAEASAGPEKEAAEAPAAAAAAVAAVPAGRNTRRSARGAIGGKAATTGAGVGKAAAPLRPIGMRDFGRALRSVAPSVAAARVEELGALARQWGAVGAEDAGAAADAPRR